MSPLEPGETAMRYAGDRVFARPHGSRDTLEMVKQGQTSALVFGRESCEVCVSQMETLVDLLLRIHADIHAIVLLDPPDPALRGGGRQVPGLLFANAVDQNLARDLAIRHVPTLGVFVGDTLVYSWAGVPGRAQVREANRILREH